MRRMRANRSDSLVRPRELTDVKSSSNRTPANGCEREKHRLRATWDGLLIRRLRVRVPRGPLASSIKSGSHYAHRSRSFAAWRSSDAHLTHNVGHDSP